MLTTVKGYYNGNHIVIEEDIKLSVGQEVIVLLFTHKLDTGCQAMCQEHRTVKNSAFRRRRIINRLDSVTVSNVGVNSNVIVTVLEMKKPPKEKIDLKKYMGRGEKMFQTDAQEYIRELR